MTSITNKTAHSAVSASLKSADMSTVIKNRSSMNESDLQAELIEVVPELPFSNDSEDDFSEYSDDDIEHNNHSFRLNELDDDDDDEEEPFDEYGKI